MLWTNKTDRNYIQRRRSTRLLTTARQIFSYRRTIWVCASLECRVGVRQKLLEVRLEPGASLWCRLKGISVAAVVVIPRRAGVASSIALATWLDPDKSILELKTRVGGRTGTKSLCLVLVKVS